MNIFLSCVFLHRIATFGQWKMQHWLSVTGRRESRLATGQRQWVATSETSGKWPLARLGWSSLRLEFSLCCRQATISKEWAWKCFCESTSVHHWSEDWRWKRQRSSWGRRLGQGEPGRSSKTCPCPSTGFLLSCFWGYKAGWGIFLVRCQGSWQASKSLVSLYEEEPGNLGRQENQRKLNSLSNQRALNSISENALSRFLRFHETDAYLGGKHKEKLRRSRWFMFWDFSVQLFLNFLSAL